MIGADLLSRHRRMTPVEAGLELGRGRYGNPAWGMTNQRGGAVKVTIPDGESLTLSSEGGAVRWEQTGSGRGLWRTPADVHGWRAGR